jgi:hypothetical protein
MQPTELSSSSSSSSEGEDERRQRTKECAALVITSVAAGSSGRVVPTRGGSRPGKAGNRDTGIEQGAKQIDRDYFNRFSRLPAPIAEADFERRFRMPRSVYELLREGLLETDRYFIQKRDAVGKIGASTDQKMVCALRQLAYGIPAALFASTRVFLNRPPRSLFTNFAQRSEEGSKQNGLEGLTRKSLP